MAAWHDAQRMQLERVHLQGSLIDDPPVLILASPLPGMTNGGSDLPSGLLPAEPIGAGDQAQAVRGISGGRVGPVHTNDGDRRSTLPGSAAVATGGSF